MKKFAMIIMGLGCFSTVNAVDINADKANHNNLRPVVFEDTSDLIKSSANHLKGIGMFNVKEGGCKPLRKTLRQEVVCVTSSSDEGTKITIPYEGSYGVKSDNPDALDVAKFVYEKAINTDENPYDTKLSYISKTKDGFYRLYTSDYRGNNETLLLESDKPLLSPTWSPNGRYLAYVSYETIRTSIFVHDVRTGKRVKVYENRGLNGYPSFMDDNNLLLSISNERVNSDIYQYNLLTKKLLNVSNTKKPEVFPKQYDAGYVFIRMHKDIPYLYKMVNGRTHRIYQASHNAPDISENGDVLVSVSGGKVFINRDGEIIKVNAGGSVESPTISNDGEITYVSREINGRSIITAINRAGKKIFNLSKKNQDLIQISAY